MITSVFKKSTPLNYSLVVILMLFFFLLYQFQDLAWFKSMLLIAQKVFIFLLLVGTLFVVNFICKKNGLSKDSTYTVFFFLLYLLFFPSLFDNLKIVAANVYLQFLLLFQTLQFFLFLSLQHYHFLQFHQINELSIIQIYFLCEQDF